MPGLVIAISKSPQHSHLEADVAAICAAMTRQPWHRAQTSSAAPLYFGKTDIGVWCTEEQPLWNADRSFAAMFWGELTLSSAKRADLGITAPAWDKSTPDVHHVLRAFEIRGPDFVELLAGCFVAAVWDATNARLHVACDRFGLRQIFWTQDNERILLATGPRALLAAAGTSFKIDERAVADMLAFGYVTGDRTLFDEVRLIPPAHVWTADLHARKVTERRYWEIDCNDSTASISRPRFEEYAREMADTFRIATEECTRGHDPCAISLSGGLDSRAIAASLPARIGRVEAFTWGVSGEPDVDYAARVARILGLSHTVAATDPHNILARLSTIVEITSGLINCMTSLRNLNYAAMRDPARVNYDGHSMFEILANTDVPFERARQKLLNAPARSEWPALVGPDRADRFHEMTRASIDHALERCSTSNVANMLWRVMIENRKARWMGPGNFIRNDYLEVRTPIYHYAIGEFARNLPPALRTSRRLYVRALQLLAPQLNSVPITDSNLPQGFPTGLHNHAQSASRGLGWLAWHADRLAGRPQPVDQAGSGQGRGDLVRSDPVLRDGIRHILFDPDNPLLNFVSPHALHRQWDNLLTGRERKPDRISRYLTLSLAFRFNGVSI